MPKGRCTRAKSADGLYEILPVDHRLPYPMEEIIDRLIDAGDYLEFQSDYAPEILCATAKLHGRSIGNHCESPRLSKIRRGTAHRRDRLSRIGEKSRVLRGER